MIWHTANAVSESARSAVELGMAQSWSAVYPANADSESARSAAWLCMAQSLIPGTKPEPKLLSL